MNILILNFQESTFSVTGFLTFSVVAATAVSNVIANIDNNNNNNNNNDNNDNLNNNNQVGIYKFSKELV